MSTFTKAEFIAYADKLLATHSVVFSDEECEETRHEVGGAGKELMGDVFNVEVSDITVYLDGSKLGTIFLVNEYDHARECPVVIINDFEAGAEHLVD